MKTEFLKQLGLTDDQIKSVMAENGKDITAIKEELNSTKEELKSAQETIKERDTQLEDLKKSSGDNKELKQQIETLQADNKAAKEKYESDLKDLKISNAIKMAISDKAQDIDIVSGLFDKSKLILGEDGKVTGLDEQLKSLQESKAFLFKQEQEVNKGNLGFKIGAEGGQGADINSQLAAAFGNNTN